MINLKINKNNLKNIEIKKHNKIFSKTVIFNLKNLIFVVNY